MYAYIKGILTYKNYPVVVLEAGGVGYKISTTTNTIGKLPELGETVTLYTYLNVKEDIMELYGFYTREELSVFELLISVSGVGPKVGATILSSVNPQSFVVAVATGDAKAITKAQGVGPKLAARIILELKDKINKDGSVEIPESVSQGQSLEVNDEAVEALMVLGYSPSEAKKAVAGLTGSVEDIISVALKNLMKR
ncbi:MAG: Holliday junction branch migration protein RuvA [Clostridia bacterium]|nr:Holliday junction branch migration protein RuvA [Clostridia bacterium]